MASHTHYDTGHVLVAAWDSNAGIVVLGTGYSLNTIGNDLSGLKRESHS